MQTFKPVSRLPEGSSRAAGKPPALQRSAALDADLVDALDGRCACGGECTACAAAPAGGALPIGPPDDVFERDADEVAARVLAGEAVLPAPAAAPAVQRACACGGSLERDDEECPECQAERLRRKEDGLAPAPVAPRSVHAVLASPGEALQTSVRESLEPHLGDLRGVRIHTDARAAESARAVAAAAYTVGQDVVFAAGRYAPDTPAGRRLLVHELAHVRQQTGPASARGPPVVLRRQPEDEKEDAPERTVSRAEEIRLSRSTPGQAFYRSRPPALRLSNFAIDSAALKREHREVLAGLAARLRTLPPSVRIVVAGHTDATGDEEHNVDVSIERAEAVRAALGPLGRGAETAAFAASTPAETNATVEGRSRNRRVEILFLPTQVRRPPLPAPQPTQEPAPPGEPAPGPAPPPPAPPPSTPPPPPQPRPSEHEEETEDDDDDGWVGIALGVGGGIVGVGGAIATGVGEVITGVGGSILSGLGNALDDVEDCVGNIRKCLGLDDDGGDDGPPEHKEPEDPEKDEPPRCGSSRLPLTVIDKTVGPLGQAGKVKASPLTRCPGEWIGSQGTTRTYPEQFECVKNATPKDEESLLHSWVPMHLLHGKTRRTRRLGMRGWEEQNLHGPGNQRWNIIIGANPMNSAFYWGVEDLALDYVYEQDEALWYEAEVLEYFPGNEFFAKRVRMRFGLYNVMTGGEGPAIVDEDLTTDETPPFCPPDLPSKKRPPRPGKTKKPVPVPPTPAPPTPAAPTPAAPAPAPAARSIFASTVRICHNVLHSRKFTLSRNGLLVQLHTGWTGNSAFGGCDQQDVYLTLTRPGLLFDNEIGTEILSPGHSGVAWPGIEPGEYRLTIEVDDHEEGCCLDGSINVMEFSPG